MKFIPELPYLMTGNSITTDHSTQDPLCLDEVYERNTLDEGICYVETDIDVENTIEISSFEDEMEIKEESDADFDTKNSVADMTGCINCGQHPAYSVHTYKNETRVLHFYTGLEDYNKLMFVFYSLGDAVKNLNYFYDKPPLHLDPLEQFCMTLLILRRHREFEDVAVTYRTSVKQVTNIFITWIRYMAIKWRSIDLWLKRDAVTKYMPLDFHDKYPNTRVLIDATECPIRKPRLPTAQQITFSTYKNRNTIKLLVGLAPSGLITYISPCYGGSASDRQIIERSSILNRFDYNDEIMVDKGLNVQDKYAHIFQKGQSNRSQYSKKGQKNCKQKSACRKNNWYVEDI